MELQELRYLKFRIFLSRLPLQGVVLENHVEVRLLALVVQVLLPHRHRVHPEPVSHVLDPGFRHQHALGSAEAPEGRVRLNVGLAAVAPGSQVLDVVGVVGLEQCAVHHGEREVRSVAGIVVLQKEKNSLA